MKRDALALVAGLASGVLGYFVFLWLARHGAYALILPGAAIGIVAGLFRPRSALVPVLCGAAALLVGVFSEWRIAPFIKDDGFGYFVTHLHQLPAVTGIMLGLGVVISVVSARGSARTGPRTGAGA